VDVVIQSTDKNFLVPVGGAIIASGDHDVIRRICKSYPGRANSSPVVVSAMGA
jgi:O-phospho-L-seryl-tRNASec:L-selenocysteinyl-tRNA synthase